MIYQRTLRSATTVTGIGIHTGKKITMVVHPKEADFGIQFRRVDLKDADILKAHSSLVGATENNTTIGEGVNAVHTVEHLLAVFYGLGIDNAYIEINGPEVPIMDGSGASFLFLFKETGIETLSKPKTFLLIKKPIEVYLDDKWAKLEPHPKLLIDSTIMFPHPIIKKQRRVFEFSYEAFILEISRARTFGLMRDVDYLKRRGLIKGGSLDNAIVLDDFRVLNSEGLRFKDEFIRHKILDTIGDVSLLGHELIGKITTFKSGHNLHSLLCNKLLENKDAYELVAATSLEKETLASYEMPSVLSSAYS